MSLRAEAIKWRKSLEGTIGSREPRRNIWPALLGDGSTGDWRTHVMVDGSPNEVYVRVPNRGVMQAAYNINLPPRANLAVLVGPTQENPDRLYVLGMDLAAIENLGDYRYVGHHHEAHEFRNPYGGDDVVWNQKQQYIPFLARPSDPFDMEVYILPDFYLYLVDWQYWPGGAVDLTGHLPAVGQARYVLISINAETNIATMTDGVDFPPFPPTNPSAHIPDCPTGHFPIAAVYLLDTTTEINWINLFDVRIMVSGGVGTEVPAAHHLLDTLTHDDTVAYHIPVAGDMIQANTDAPAEFWDVLPIGAAHNVMRVNAAGDQAEWRSMVHDHSAGIDGGQQIENLITFSFDPRIEFIVGNEPNLVYAAYLVTFTWDHPAPATVSGIDVDDPWRPAQDGAICFIGSEPVYLAGIHRVVDIVHNDPLGDRPIHLISEADYRLTRHPLLLIREESTGEWYEIDWTGSAGGLGAHGLLSDTHMHTVPNPPSRGSLIYVPNHGLWSELVYPGVNYHFQTIGNNTVWNKDISMGDYNWIGLSAWGGRIIFKEEALLYYGKDEIYIMDADVGIGTEYPNISNSALGVTLEAALGGPSLELSYLSDGIYDDEIIGAVRWFHGDVIQRPAGRIDMIEDGTGEDKADMRFFASDAGVQCLVMTLTCAGVTFHTLGEGFARMSASGLLISDYDVILAVQVFS